EYLLPDPERYDRSLLAIVYRERTGKSKKDIKQEMKAQQEELRLEEKRRRQEIEALADKKIQTMLKNNPPVQPEQKFDEILNELNKRSGGSVLQAVDSYRNAKKKEE